MYKKDRNGYTAGAVLFLPLIKKMREHIEFEKFQCRVLKDDDRTKKMRVNTQVHPNKIFKLRYNNETSEKLTAAGRKNDGDQ